MKCHLVCLLVLCAMISGAEEKQNAKNLWSVFGRVTDAAGQGMPDVDVHASCGLGSLMPKSETKTDADGNYSLSFSPGFVLLDKSGHANISKTLSQWTPQFAVISPRKPGYYEKHLKHQGELRMVGESTSPEELKDIPSDKRVWMNKPKRLDFVMLKSASIRGRVVDRKGRPVSGQRFCFDGNEIGPAASVFDVFSPDQEGRFSINNVPLKSYWFRPADGKLQNVQSNELTFDKPVEYEVLLTVNRKTKKLVASFNSNP